MLVGTDDRYPAFDGQAMKPHVNVVMLWLDASITAFAGALAVG
jgi:hypothetical protein